MTRQHLWVILYRLPEKGRKEIEEIVNEMKESDRKKEKQGWRWTEKEITPHLYTYLLQG